MFLKLTDAENKQTVVVNYKNILHIIAREGNVGGSIVYCKKFKHAVSESLDEIMNILNVKSVE
jgi:hypothetical protein